MRIQAAFVAALIFVHSVHGFSPPNWYRCNPDTCKAPNCQCAASHSPLPTAQTPQFVLITNDDSVDGNTARKINKITSSAKNSNGCPIPATWFTLVAGSSCSVVQERFQKGDEFACHTMTHKELTSSTSKSTMTKEIVGSRNWLVEKCGLPASSVTGFRSPFLTVNKRVRQVLNENGFLYDTSNSFDNNEMNNRPWPFTMDAGIPDRSCGSSCGKGESYKGLWNIPVWTLKYDGQAYSMDPGMKTDWGEGDERPVDDVMKAVFDTAYESNRAPVPLWVHVYWLSDRRINEAQKFVKYAASKPDVYFVTMRQLIEWMQNPVPTSEMAAWLKARCRT